MRIVDIPDFYERLNALERIPDLDGNGATSYLTHLPYDHPDIVKLRDELDRSTTAVRRAKPLSAHGYWRIQDVDRSYLEQLRKDRGYTQLDLALALGMTQGGYSKRARGVARFTKQELSDAAAFLGVDEQALLHKTRVGELS